MGFKSISMGCSYVAIMSIEVGVSGQLQIEVFK